MRNALLALPLLAACALHAQDATVTPTTGRVLTLTAQVTIPENPQGVLLSLRTSSDNAFDLYLNGNQENNAGFYIYAGDDARPTSAFNNQTFTLPPWRQNPDLRLCHRRGKRSGGRRTPLG